MSLATRNAARAIFASALRAVDIRAAVQSRITRQGDMLTFAGKGVQLSEFDRIVTVAMGKAAVPMYMAAAEALQGLEQTAVIVAPLETLPPASSDSAVFLPGAHPTPTADSLHAAARILALLRTVTPRTVVLFLISGGASAMVEQPLNPDISLDDLTAFSRGLVGAGMSITAMNTLRKHLSAVKGGRLAVAAAAARMQCTLLISDVPHASPDAVASGPSLPDSASVVEARLLLKLLEKSSPQPESVTRWFRQASLPATANAGEAAFARSHWEVILSSHHLEQAAVKAAELAGFATVVDNTCDDWEYRDAAEYLLRRSRTLAAAGTGPTCVISVGEIGVSLPHTAGEGGRNQQFALWCARRMAASSQTATVFSAGTDGIDGHSIAAGAVCDETTPARAFANGDSADAALEAFNSTPLLQGIGDTIETGPTGNNLRDLRLILTEPMLT